MTSHDLHPFVRRLRVQGRLCVPAQVGPLFLVEYQHSSATIFACLFKNHRSHKLMRSFLDAAVQPTSLEVKPRADYRATSNHTTLDFIVPFSFPHSRRV